MSSQSGQSTMSLEELFPQQELSTEQIKQIIDALGNDQNSISRFIQHIISTGEKNINAVDRALSIAIDNSFFEMAVKRFIQFDPTNQQIVFELFLNSKEKTLKKLLDFLDLAEKGNAEWKEINEEKPKNALHTQIATSPISTEIDTSEEEINAIFEKYDKAVKEYEKEQQIIESEVAQTNQTKQLTQEQQQLLSQLGGVDKLPKEERDRLLGGKETEAIKHQGQTDGSIKGVEEDNELSKSRQAELEHLDMIYIPEEDYYTYIGQNKTCIIKIRRSEGVLGDKKSENTLINFYPNEDAPYPLNNVVFTPEQVATVFLFRFNGAETNFEELANLQRLIDEIEDFDLENGQEIKNKDSFTNRIAGSLDYVINFLSHPEDIKLEQFYSKKVGYYSSVEGLALRQGIAALLINNYPKSLNVFLSEPIKYAGVIDWLKSIGYLIDNKGVLTKKEFGGPKKEFDFLFRNVHQQFSEENEKRLESLGIFRNVQNKDAKQLFEDLEGQCRDSEKARLVFNLLNKSFGGKGIQQIFTSDMAKLISNMNIEPDLKAEQNKDLKLLLLKLIYRIIQLKPLVLSGSDDERRIILNYLSANKYMLEQIAPIEANGKTYGYWDIYVQVKSLSIEMTSKVEEKFDMEAEDLDKESLMKKINRFYDEYIEHEQSDKASLWAECENLMDLNSIEEILSWLQSPALNTLRSKVRDESRILIDLGLLRLRTIMIKEGFTLSTEQQEKILNSLFEQRDHFNSIFNGKDLASDRFYGIGDLMLFQGLKHEETKIIQHNLKHFVNDVDKQNYREGNNTRLIFTSLLKKASDAERIVVLEALVKAYQSASSDEIALYIAKCLGKDNNSISQFPDNLDEEERKALATLFFEALMVRPNLNPISSQRVGENTITAINHIFNPLSIDSTVFLRWGNENGIRKDKYYSLMGIKEAA